MSTSRRSDQDTSESVNILNAARIGDLTHLKEKRHLVLETFDRFDATPVHFAARGGQLETLRWIYSEFGKTCLLAQAKSGATPAHDAATLGHLSCLEFILNHVDTSQYGIRDQSGATPLHLATRFDHLHVVQWLVEAKRCDILTPSKRDITPVHIAAGRGAISCLRYFTRMREDVANVQTENGATPIYFAAQEGRLDCLKILVLEGHGNPRQRANDGMTALHAAAQNGHLHCVIWLVTHGGLSVMERDKDGATPLHYAAARGHLNVLRWLLQNGAMLVKDELGGTPLHDAAEHGEIETVRVLLEAGADVQARDVDGQTAEGVAGSAGHHICAECIRAAVQDKSARLPTRRQSQPFIRNMQHRFSISSARTAGKDLYRSVGRRKKRPPNTISSPNLAALTKDAIENGVELVEEMKSSKSLPSSGRSPRIEHRHRPTFLQRASPSSNRKLSNERAWFNLEEPDEPVSILQRKLGVANRKIGFSGVSNPLSSPDIPYLPQSPTTPPAISKSHQHVSLENIPDKDKYGNAIPEWKRLVMARRAQRELQPDSKLDNRTRSKSLSDQSVRSLTDTQKTQTIPLRKRNLGEKKIPEQPVPTTQ